MNSDIVLRGATLLEIFTMFADVRLLFYISGNLGTPDNKNIKTYMLERVLSLMNAEFSDGDVGNLQLVKACQKLNQFLL